MPRPSARRVLLGLLVTLGVSLSGGYLVYEHRPEWLFQARLLSVRDHPLRRAYEREVAGLRDRAGALRAAGRSEEEIAHELWAARRALGVKYKDLTPEPLRRRIHELNRRRYGDPLGPPWEHLVRKHSRNGRTDWAAISDSAARSNPDVDKLFRSP